MLHLIIIQLKTNRMATFLITDTDNWIINKDFFYLLWFQPTLGGIAIRKNGIHIFLDKRYFEKTKKINQKRICEKTNAEKVYFHEITWPLIDAMLISCSDSKAIEVEESLTLKYFKEIKNKSDMWVDSHPKKMEIIPSFFEKIRICKSEREQDKLSKAIKIIDQVALYIEYLIKSKQIIWKTEIEVRNIIINKILEFWWEAESFNSIVAFWEHSAIAHHSASDTVIENGPLLIDMWAIYKWYCSDFTRTYWVGAKTKDYEEFANIYQSVKKAHIKAILWARVGMKAHEIDLIARKSIEKDWYGSYFSHSTGHWIWVNVHEKPWINQLSQEEIQPGMVFTIEPWIYLPWKFWVRIENIVFAKSERVKCSSKISY